MADAAVRVLGARVRGGIVVGAEGAWNVPSLDCIRGGHPVPTAESERAGRRALELARAARPDELVLFLFSGGASALMAVPADGLTLEDKQRTTERLLRAGADIYTLNTVRKHLSAIKGGQLAAATSNSRTLAISDVLGDDLSVIASGPTVADASTFQEAVEAIRRSGGIEAFPGRVVSHLARGAAGALPETPKPHEARLACGTVAVVGSRHDAMQGAADAASTRGYDVISMEAAVVGEARAAAHTYLDEVTRRVSARGRVARPTCVVSSGETTVRVTGCGRGGRNQEFALALVDRMAVARSRLSSSPVWARTGSTVRPTLPVRSWIRVRPHAPESPVSIRRAFSATTTPTPSLRRCAISSTRVRPARTSATSRSCCSA